MIFRCVGRLHRRLRGEATSSDPSRRAGEDGFSLIETVMALGLVFTVMLGLLASLSTGIRGLTTGRQRTGAVAIAKEVVEQARAAAHANVGHDLNDGTLATDPDVTGTGPAYFYEPEGGSGPEPLVGSANPVFATHEWSETRDNVPFTVRVYVTDVSVAIGDGHKRLTVKVSWDHEQYDAATVANEINVSTFVSKFGVVSDGDASGVVDVDGGAIRVTGVIDGLDVSEGRLFFPLVHGDTTKDLVAETRGLAQSARSSLDVTTGTVSGCGSSGTSGTCDGVKAESAADNDGGTALPLQDKAGPTGDSGWTLSGGPTLSLSAGATGAVTSSSSAQSCTVCSPSIGDGDGRVYAYDRADGPASMDASFAAGILSGFLADLDAAGSATATVDEDAVSGVSAVDSVATMTAPEIDLVTLLDGPVGYTSAVNVSPVDVTAQAEAGPGAASPTVTGDAITVTMYDTGFLGLPEYRSVTFSPGDTVNETASVSFDVLDSLLGITNTVTLETTVTAGAASTSREPAAGTIETASASLANWFTVQVRVVSVEAGSTVLDTTVELDYGRLAATATVES